MNENKSVEFSLIGLAGLLAEHGFRVVAGGEVNESEYRPEKRRITLTVAPGTPGASTLRPGTIFDPLTTLSHEKAEELRDFIGKRAVFEAGSLISLDIIYTAYLDHHGFNQDEVARGEALGRHKLTRMILKTYGEFVSERVARIDGKATRCLSGLKLRSLEELVETEASPGPAA
jgi:hypothetical protein